MYLSTSDIDSFCLQKREKLLSQALLEEYKYAVKEKKMSSLLLTIQKFLLMKKILIKKT